MDTNKKIHTLFHPRAIAIIGASRTIGKWGFTFCLHLIKGEFKGEVYPVNPAGGTLLGKKVYKSLSELPQPVDTAFILLPPEKVAGTITECGQIGIQSIVVITAGFQELGQRGKQLQDQVVEAANNADIGMVGPNCAGIASPAPLSLHIMMQPNFPKPGGIAVISQSGNIAGSILYLVSRQDIGVSRCVSVGNQAQLKVEDFLEYLITDDQTKVVTLYLESVSDGKRFMDVARRLTKVKPLIIIKGGQTEIGVSAAKSHTGAIAGSGAVFTGMCRQSGVILVDDVEEMLDIAVALLSQPLPAGNRVGIIANGGGWGVLTADACIKAGLDVVELPEDLLKALDERLPAWWNRQNPVDMVAGLSRGAFFKAIAILAESKVIDGLITLGFGYGHGNAHVFDNLPDDDNLGFEDYKQGTLYSDKRGKEFLLNQIETHKKPILISSEFMVGADREQNEAVLNFRKENVFVYPGAVRAARVLAHLAFYGMYKQREPRQG